MCGPSAPLRASASDQYVTDVQETETSILRQAREVRDETAAEAKRNRELGREEGRERGGRPI